MKTILFTFIYPFHPERGGIERVDDLLARAFIQRGYKVLYLCSTYPDNYKGYDYPAPLFTLPDKQENCERNIKFYDNFLKEHKVDIVFNNSYYSIDPIYLNTGSNTNVKRITIIHNRPKQYYNELYSKRNCTRIEQFKYVLRNCFTMLKGGKWAYRRNLEKTFSNISNNSERVCLLSSNYIDEYLQLVPNTPQEKLIATPNPNTYPKQAKSFKKKKQLLFVGRLEYFQKRPDRILKVWGVIYSAHPDWELVFVGDGPDKEALKKLAEKFDRVRFVGYQNPKTYYEEASIFCMTSQYEGFPMVLAEAIVHGAVPIAFHSFASITDIIEDERNGVLVTPFSLDEYAEKLSSLMGDETRRNEMAQRAIKSVERYDVEKIADRWEDIFSTL